LYPWKIDQKTAHIGRPESTYRSYGHLRRLTVKSVEAEILRKVRNGQAEEWNAKQLFLDSKFSGMWDFELCGFPKFQGNVKIHEDTEERPDQFFASR